MRSVETARTGLTGVALLTLVMAIGSVGVAGMGGSASGCNLSDYIKGQNIRMVAVAEPGRLPGLLAETRTDYAAHLLLLSRLLEGDEANRALRQEFRAQMPSSKVEFDLFFEGITNLKEWSVPAVRAAFQGFFDVVSALGAKDVEFTEGALELSFFADGEAKNYTDEVAAKICRKAPDLFAKALNRLPPDERAFVPSCGNAGDTR